MKTFAAILMMIVAAGSISGYDAKGNYYYGNIWEDGQYEIHDFKGNSSYGEIRKGEEDGHRYEFREQWRRHEADRGDEERD